MPRGIYIIRKTPKRAKILEASRRVLDNPS